MRAWVLLVLVALALCCALASTEEDMKSTDSGQLQVSAARGLDKNQEQMSDEPVEVVAQDTTRPKKKKTPEEIEAGKWKRLLSTHASLSLRYFLAFLKSEQ